MWDLREFNMKIDISIIDDPIVWIRKYFVAASNS